MKNRTIVALKCVVFPLCLLPVWLVWREAPLAADPVQAITHATGSDALWFLMASLAVTPVRRLHKSLAWLIRFRRMLGLFAFFYATLHLLTYVFLFSGFDVAGVWANLRHGSFKGFGQAWSDVWPGMVDDVKKRKFIQVGLFCWVILLALTMTSPAWIMRKMGGKRWQWLHRSVYVAGWAAVIHYWWLVKPGVMGPMRPTLVLVVLLLARVVWVVMKRRRASRATVAA